MGDRFESISNSTLVNRSYVENAFNRVAAEGHADTAHALRLIADKIETSGSKDAADTFNHFADELRKPDPKPSVLKALWKGVTSAMPTILQMTDAVSKITALFTV